MEGPLQCNLRAWLLPRGDTFIWHSLGGILDICLSEYCSYPKRMVNAVAKGGGGCCWRAALLHSCIGMALGVSATVRCRMTPSLACVALCVTMQTHFKNICALQGFLRGVTSRLTICASLAMLMDLVSFPVLHVLEPVKMGDFTGSYSSLHFEQLWNVSCLHSLNKQEKKSQVRWLSQWKD